MAERYLRQALEGDPAYVPGWDALGALYERRGQVERALEAYGQALRTAPGDAEANAAAAELLALAGHPAEAHEARAHYFRAQGLPMRAIEEYEALARQPEHRKAAVLEMGLILLETRQKGKAIQVTRDALAEHPDDPALSERLVVLEMMWDHHQAEKLCEAWQRREPGSLRPVWLLARIASSQSDLPRAEQWLQQCLGREPDNPDYVVSMAEVLLRDRRRASLERARELLERAAARPAADVGTVLDLAQTLQQLGQPEAARRQYLRALDLDPNNSAPYVSLVQLARPLGQPEPISLWGSLVRAVEEREREETLLARRTWETPADPAGHEQLALYEVRNDELRKAEAQLEEALRLRPGWAEAARELAAVRRAREALQ